LFDLVSVLLWDSDLGGWLMAVASQQTIFGGQFAAHDC